MNTQASDRAATILHVMRPAAGGMKRHLELLTPRLRARGYEIILAAPLCVALSGASADEQIPLNMSSGANPLKDFLAAHSLKSTVARVDLVHAHGLRAALIAAMAMRNCSIPLL